MNFLKTMFIALFAVTMTSAASDAAVYNVNRTIGGGSVVGFIETDGTLGTISDANIVDWEFTLTASVPLFGGLASDTISKSASLASSAVGLIATTTSLSLDFSGSAGLNFQGNSFNAWCAVGSQEVVCTPGSEIIVFTTNGGVAESAARSGTLVIATAQVGVVPLPASLPLLAAGFAVFAGIRRRKHQQA